MAQTRSQGTSRLPSTRESRPAMIGLAILLIVGGALASGYLALQAGNRASFVVVKQDVAPGAKITSDDLGKVSLPEDYQNGVPWSEADKIVDNSATVQLLPGTVLTRSMVSTKKGIDPDKSQLTIPFDDSPFVRDLRPGARLALNIGGDSSTGGNTARQSVYAEVVDVSQPKESGGLGGSAGSDSISIVVSIDVSCLSVVSQGIEDQAVYPAVIGDADNSAIQRTCKG